MDFNTVKKLMAESYSRKAEEYGTVRNRRFDAFLQKEIEGFVEATLSVDRRVIDLGSGPGNESLLLRKANLDPVCVDIAVGMVEQCKNKGIKACVMDFVHPCFCDEVFAGAWMAFALLHVPKNNASEIIKEVHRILVPGGVFYVSLFEGEGELFRKEDIIKYGCERYFAYYHIDELKALMFPCFEITKLSRLDLSPRPTISIQGTKVVSLRICQT